MVFQNRVAAKVNYRNEWQKKCFSQNIGSICLHNKLTLQETLTLQILLFFVRFFHFDEIYMATVKGSDTKYCSFQNANPMRTNTPDPILQGNGYLNMKLAVKPLRARCSKTEAPF